MPLPKQTLIDRANKMNPTAEAIRLGSMLDELATKFNAVLAKLDADAGVTDTNYTSLHKVKAINERQ